MGLPVDFVITGKFRLPKVEQIKIEGHVMRSWSIIIRR